MNKSYFPIKHLILVALLSVGMVTFVAAQFTDDGDAARFNGDRVLENLNLPDQQAGRQTPKPTTYAQASVLSGLVARSNDTPTALSVSQTQDISEALKPDNLAPPAPVHYTHVEELSLIHI